MPFGRPVVPEVYSTYSGSVASTATQSAGDADWTSVVPVQVSPGPQGRRAEVPLVDDASRRCVGRSWNACVDQWHVVDRSIDFLARARREQDLGSRVVDANGQFMRRESAKDHRVNRSQASAGQHAHHGLGNHRHIDDDGVPPTDTQLLQTPGQAGHLLPAVPGRCSCWHVPVTGES